MTKLYTTDGIFKETRSDRLRGKRLEVYSCFFQNLWVSKEKGCKNTYALMISCFLAKLVPGNDIFTRIDRIGQEVMNECVYL